MADSDSEGIDNLLGDIDDLDDELFGGKKKQGTKKRLSNLDDLFSKNKEQAARPKRNLNDLLSAANKKPAVSFLDQTTPTPTKRTVQKDEQRRVDEVDTGLSNAKNLASDPPLRRATASSRTQAQELLAAGAPSMPTSNADDLFGPLQRSVYLP
ncbi:unnamed protein product [Anisakis simplex]|uniref:NUC153 domain-containing protein n=1 Tax=Anisakis simplex TaxID=6269 RepID=A0A0M3JTB1_ANISI|nr:unnamed protein product [Anisakis simplex]